MSVNTNFANVFENMQQIVEDRQNGIRAADNIIAFDEKLNPLSIGYPCELTLDGKRFTSADHALLFLRALAFKDEYAMRQIVNSGSMRQAQAVQIARFNVNVWRRYERQSMQVVVGAKLQQHKFVRDALKMTGAKRLVYASKTDKYFGCGLTIIDDNVMYPQFWSGQNQLGHIFEQYRKTV